MLSFLKLIRHGRLSFLGPIWVLLGTIVRSTIVFLKIKAHSRHMIGPYGYFFLDAYFAFSDFKNWGKGHNNGFFACIEACNKKHCFLDIGGHIGLVSLPASRVLASGGTVHSFEPVAANLYYLKRHCELNNIDNIEIHETLVGDAQEEVDFFENKNPSGQNARVVKKFPEKFNKKIRNQTTIDLCCSERNIAPEVIKIDVEGSEINVLKGARSIITKYQPLIFLSVHPAEIVLMGQTLEELSEIIDSLNYSCFEINGAEALEFRLAEYLLKPSSNIF